MSLVDWLSGHSGPFNLDAINSCSRADAVANLLQYVQDEIGIRVESLKHQLDELNERIARDYDDQASAVKRYLANPVPGNDQTRFMVFAKLFRLPVSRSKKCFQPSSSLIGELNYKFDVEKFLKMKFDRIELSTLNKIKYPMGMCVLGDGKQLAIADYHNNSINIFDSKLQLVDSILVEAKLPHRIEVDESSSIFFVHDKMSGYVYIHDIKSGTSKPIVISELDSHVQPKAACFRDICYYDKCLFALESGEKCQIHRFDKSGQRLRSIFIKQEPSRPCSIRVTNHLLAVNDSYESVKFYDYNGKFKFKIGPVLENEKFDCFTFADDHALVYFNSGLIKCYNMLMRYESSSGVESGQLVGEHLRNDASFMCYFNKKILIAYPWKKQLGVLS